MTQEELERVSKLIEAVRKVFDEIWERIKAAIEALTRIAESTIFEIQVIAEKLGCSSTLARRYRIAKTIEKCKIMKAKEAHIAMRTLFRARSNC